MRRTAFITPLLMFVGLLFFGNAAVAATAATVAPLPPATATSLDISPILGDVIQFFAAIASILLPALLWAGWGWLQKHTALKSLQIDDAQRAVVDQGLQKAIGSAVSELNSTIVANRGAMTLDVKSKVVQNAASYAIQHIPDALAHFHLQPEQVAAMVEARLGMAAVAATVQTPPLAAGSAPAAPAVPAAAGAPSTGAPA